MEDKKQRGINNNKEIGEDIIDRIIRIGIKGGCSKKELMGFLPDYSTIHGDELIFLIPGKIRVKKINDIDLRNIIKGLHCIELEYRKVTNNDFGFGSTSPAYRIIRHVRYYYGSDKKYQELIIDLNNWIAFNGGNYYIKSEDTSKDCSKENPWEFALQLHQSYLRYAIEQSKVFDVYDFTGRKVRFGMSEEHIRDFRNNKYYKVKLINKKDNIARTKEIIKSTKECMVSHENNKK